MKRSAFFLTIAMSTLLITLFSCQNNSNKAEKEDPPRYDTIVEVRTDTIITFDPSTYVETVTIQKSYDTTIMMNGEKVDLKVTRPLK